jgi:hypothetical protein
LLFTLGAVVMIALVFVERRYLRPAGSEDVVAPSPTIE